MTISHVATTHVGFAAWLVVTAVLMSCSGEAGDLPPQQTNVASQPEWSPQPDISLEFDCHTQAYNLNWKRRIGSRVPEDPAYLQRPTAVGIDKTGRIFVADRDLDTIRVFAASGELLRNLSPPTVRFGAMGEVVGLAVTESGRVYIWDYAKQRMLRYSPTDNTFASSTLLGTPSSLLPPPIVAHDRAGVAVAVQHTDPLARTFDHIRHFDLTGEETVRFGPFPTSTVLTIRTGQLVSSVSLPFDLADRTVWTLDPRGRLLLANARQHRIVALSQAGDTLWTLDSPPRRVPVSQEDINATLHLAETTGIEVSDVEELLPSTKSSVLELLASEQWLIVRRPRAGPHLYRNAYDFFLAPDNSYCGYVELPFRIVAIRDPFLLGIHYAPTELPTLHVYRFGRVPR